MNKDTKDVLTQIENCLPPMNLSTFVLKVDI